MPGNGWRRSATPVFWAASSNPSIRRLAASARPVASPTVRRVSCHAAPGGPVNTVGAIADSAPNVLGRQRLRTQDQVRGCGSDGAQVGSGARARGRHVVHDGAEVGRLTGRAVRQRGRDDPRLQAQRAQRVELVAGEHHDALRVRAHLGAARGVADLAPVAAPRRAARGRGRRIRRACARCPARRRRRSWWCW